MFQSIKRAIYISKYAGLFKATCPHIEMGNISQAHLALQTAGVPANEFIDLYMTTKTYDEHPCGLIASLYEAVFQDSKSDVSFLYSWVTRPEVIVHDTHGLAMWLTALRNVK